MADIQALKESAGHFMHPERHVKVDAASCGRNYFTRASAPEYESVEDADLREQILEDARVFKQIASDYLHPELPAVIYCTATGRNFFTRASASEYESLEDAEARAHVMEDMRAFKEIAVDFLHPELPAVVYATATGRNFFMRPSAPTGEEEEERQAIMADLQALKQSAINYMHPELPVKTTDATATGRNFFTRYSATEFEDPEQVAVRDRILEEAEALKYWATEFLHPERPVITSDAIATGRNYYARPSSIVHDHMIQTFPRHEDEHTDHHSEHLDHFGMDEELDFMFGDLGDNLLPAVVHEQDEFAKVAAGSDEEGKLSRSPSSVMLAFDESVY
jgi:hypothetical protein